MVRSKLKASYSNRLSAISSIFPKTPIKCSNCGRLFSKEQAFSVSRWSSGKTSERYTYCKLCASSKRGVLLLIDTDNIPYGISNVDDFFDFQKLDNRSYLSFKEKIFKGFLGK